MPRLLEAYVVAVAFAALGGAVGLAVLPGEPFLLAVAGAVLGTPWTGAVGIVGLSLLGIPPALLTLALVRGAERSERIRMAVLGGSIWAGWFVLLGFAVLAAGGGWPKLEWSLTLSVFDVVIAAVAGALFATIVRDAPRTDSPA